MTANPKSPGNSRQTGEGEKQRLQSASGPEHDAAMIILPARPGRAGRNAARMNASHLNANHNSPAKGSQPARQDLGPQENNATTAQTSREKEREAVAPLPEYQPPVNGLRELLTSIDSQPANNPDHVRPPSGAGTANMANGMKSLESIMYLPPSQTTIASSPDLPITPANWLKRIAAGAASLLALLIIALAYSHFTSPNGIKWTRVEARLNQLWHHEMKSDEPKDEGSYGPARLAVANPRKTDETSSSSPLPSSAPLSSRPLANSRIYTTSAHTSRTTAMPRPMEVFLSPQELEKQIRMLEKRSHKIRHHHKIQRRKPRRRLLAKNRPPSSPAMPAKIDLKSAASNNPTLERLAAPLPAKQLDPAMEAELFARARSYLHQRDISSARMILQYAASLGSGMAAMAMAESYDPAHLAMVNIPQIYANPAMAAKWYDRALHLGIKEARRKLAALTLSN